MRDRYPPIAQETVRRRWLCINTLALDCTVKNEFRGMRSGATLDDGFVAAAVRGWQRICVLDLFGSVCSPSFVL